LTGNVTPEEAQAIREAVRPRRGEERSARVEPRQFDRPLRLSGAVLDKLRERIKKALPDVERELAPAMRSTPKLALAEVSEVNAESLAATLAPPLAALRFEVDKQPGWFVWECAAALDVLEVALGAAAPEKNSARPFTALERSMFARVVTQPVTCLARALALDPSSFSVAQDLESLGSWRQGGEKAEMQRLCVALSLESPIGASTWRLYFPGVVPSSRAAARPAPAAALPAHLADVQVELRARLGAGEVPLAELLALEVGDVIPLGLTVGEPLQVLVEDQACLIAALGKLQGQLAISVARGRCAPKSEG
jgi:flagellar motor switch protein FliM